MMHTPSWEMKPVNIPPCQERIEAGARAPCLVSGGDHIRTGFQAALGEIDLLKASLTGMFLIEFVGENLRFPPTVRAFADKGL
jgi:hypothetical protein